MGRHMVALWCQSCTRGRFWSTWSVCALPSGVLVWIYGFLDVVSGSRSQRCNWKCLRTPLAEARVMPLPRFMSINNVVPPPQSLYITRQSLPARVRRQVSGHALADQGRLLADQGPAPDRHVPPLAAARQQSSLSPSHLACRGFPDDPGGGLGRVRPRAHGRYPTSPKSGGSGISVSGELCCGRSHRELWRSSPPWQAGKGFIISVCGPGRRRLWPWQRAAATGRFLHRGQAGLRLAFYSGSSASSHAQHLRAVLFEWAPWGEHAAETVIPISAPGRALKLLSREILTRCTAADPFCASPLRRLSRRARDRPGEVSRHHLLSESLCSIPLRCPSCGGDLSVTVFLVYLYLSPALRLVGDTCLALVLVIQAKGHASGAGGVAPLKPAGRSAKGTGNGAETV